MDDGHVTVVTVAQTASFTKALGPRILRPRFIRITPDRTFGLIIMPKASKAAFYAVHRGRQAGVYTSWCDMPCDDVVYYHSWINMM